MPESPTFTVTDQALARVARYAEVFGDPAFVHGRRVEPDYGKFFELLYQTGFVVDFDWSSWTRRAEYYMQNPEAVAKARLSTLVKLLTTHARADRFNEGHIADVFESGHLQAIVDRLAVIHAEKNR